MSRTKVNLRDPIFAAILAFLVPGFGHFYQRRYFKAVLYCVCILGTFFTGLQVGHGQVVYFQWKQPENRTWAYLCQFWVGLPALPALAQAKLRSKDALEPNHVPLKLKDDFQGTLFEPGYADGKPIGTVKGTIVLNPKQADTPRSWTLTGTLTTPAGSENIEGRIERGWLESEVAPWPERRISGQFMRNAEGKADEPYKLDGFIPRTLWDSYEAPLQDSRLNEPGDPTDLDRAHRELGGRFELGVMYTMIAGLLNILAMYDAYEGPAYDEDDEDEPDKPPPLPSPPQAT